MPGGVLVMLGLVGYSLALPGVKLGHIALGGHTLVYASLAILCGYQAILFAIFTTTFAINEGLRPSSPGYETFYKVMNLERGLILALLAFLAGVVCLALAVNKWRLAGFGNLNYSETMRWVVPGADRKSTRLNSSHIQKSRMPSSA